MCPEVLCGRVHGTGLPVDNLHMSANGPADPPSPSELKALAEAERQRRPFLAFRNRDGRQQLFWLAADSELVTVGRQPSADLVLDWDDQISRLHARLQRVDDAWEVVDDGPSRNGTFVNGGRLRGRRRLRDGDTLRFGTTTVAFHSPGHAELRDADEAKTPPAAGVRLSSTQRRVMVALCRPYKGRNGFARPATDEQIADELVLSVGEVRTHLRVLCAKLGVDRLPPNQARVGLVEQAFATALISERDL
jgi:pSer/pThr/pTyr-binding forkhead associated (FHA) protein